MNNINNSRRGFLKTGGALTVGSAVGMSWWPTLAHAATVATSTANDYKALVCIFLEGGNDACGTILPAWSDAESWTRYGLVRGNMAFKKIEDITPRKDAVNNPWPFAGDYPLHPQLNNVSRLFKQGNLAIVANVGNLKKETTRSNLSAPDAALPRLRSHNDQTTVWHHGSDNMAGNGWGGKTAQQAIATLQSLQGGSFVQASDVAQNFRSVVIGNNNAFGIGFLPEDSGAPLGSSTTTAYGMVRNEGVISLLPETDGKTAFDSIPMDVIKKVATGKLKTQRTNLIEQDYATVVGRALDSQTYMSALLGTVNVPSGTTFTDATGKALNTPFDLAEDLRIVAKVIKANIKAQVKGRQVFFVSLGSFDIHTDAGRHATLLNTLDQSLDYFSAAMGADMSKVVAFTASEFGRLLHANGDGFDHGWGGHHFVMGGGVHGGAYYGEVPHYKTSSGAYSHPQMMDDGALIPAISVGAYAGRLLQWFGIPNPSTILPNAAQVGNLSGLF
jgi:uncharacterized protein (DUF1501 family)